MILRLNRKTKEGILLKGLLIITFFSIFAIASILIPVPLFPGSLLSTMLLSGELITYSVLLSALINGLIYGSLLGIAFCVISNKLENDL